MCGWEGIVSGEGRSAYGKAINEQYVGVCICMLVS